MPYQIDKYNGELLVTIPDGTIDQTTDIKLVGKNYAGYGEIQNENFVFLLQNFAGGNQPPKKLTGQIWFDSISKKLKYWDGGFWKTTGGSEVTSGATPTGLVQGDFWWNSGAKQLYAYNGPNDFVLIGPQAVAGSGQTNLESIPITDTLGNPHAIVRAVVDGTPIFVISADDEFIVGAIDQSKLPGFSRIRTGITLVNSGAATGVTSTTTDRFWGTASNSDRLGGNLAIDYVLKSNPTFTSQASFPDAGITIGDNNEILIAVENAPKHEDDSPVVNIRLGTIKSAVTSTLAFKVTSPGGVRYPALLEGYTDPSVLAGAVLPGANNKYDLGSSTKRWREVRAVTVDADTVKANSFIGPISGIASKADKLFYAGSSAVDKYSSATDAWSSGNGNTIVARNASGDFTANVVTATATRARYADLAEKYDADSAYEPGTVVVFAGEKEITVTETFGDHRVAGVVSTNPAYIMNEASDGIAVALRGKVPVKVIGKVKKGDILVTSNIPGYAAAVSDLRQVSSFSAIAKSLSDKDDDGQGTVMAVVI